MKRSKLIFGCLTMVITLLLCNGCGGGEDVCVDTNCSDYISQADAQFAYDSDPECRGDLDADNDGIACEEQGNSVTICPTTASCGCSNHTKSQCESDPCCRWTVGSGCDCR